MNRSKAKLSGVLHKGFKPDKCKTSLRMAVARIKLLRNRKEVQVRQMRREIAQLLDGNQDQTARIRVEHVIREEKFMQAYDLIEVYCELIVARLSIIDSQKTCPIDLKEAIASVIFASMRCADVTELADVRKHFTSKYGKEFAAAALEVRPDSGVNRLVIEKLSAGAPDVQTKIKTLTSIAEEHNIKWEPKAFEEKLQKSNEDLLHGSTTYHGGNVSSVGSSTPSMSTPQPTYSSVSAATIDSGASRVPMGPYSPAEASSNNASSQENRRGSNASAPRSSQYGASTYYSVQIPASNNFPHENPGGQSVSRPYSQYDASVPDSFSRDDEIKQPGERKPSVSGANWKVEFKDATSAAQAAAESAEMASIAARAAAQLASRGSYSGEQSTGGFESGAYNHETAQRKQPAAHSVKDEKRSFSVQSSRTNDPRLISSIEGKRSEGAETSRLDSQNMSTAYSPSQNVHSYSSESHAYDYGMPVEPPRAHSPEPPNFDDLHDRERNIRSGHPLDFPGEKLQDTALDGRNVNDVNVSQVSSDHESTDDYYDNYNSSHVTFTHGSRTDWDNQTDKTQVNSSSVVFDQYDSEVEEENVDAFASKHTGQRPGVQDYMESSNADWTQQHRSDTPSNHRTSDLFSRTETQRSDTSEVNRRDIPSPHLYDNMPPTFDSDGGSSDEEIAAEPTKHAEYLRSRSKGSTNSGKFVRDVDESVEDYYESSPSKKSVTSPALDVPYKEQRESGHGGSPRFGYFAAQAQKNLIRAQSRDSDLSDEESEPELDKLKVEPSLIAYENQSLPSAMQTSAFDDKDEGDFGLNFSRLTPGLRNKSKQPPPYPKSSRENVLPRHSLNKASATIEESVDSEENTTSFKQIRSTTKSSRSTKTSSSGSYSRVLYDRDSSVEAPREARSTMTRNSLHSDDTEKLSEQFDNTNLVKTKDSERRNSVQEHYHDKTDIGGRREMRPRRARNFFDSDGSEEELEQRQAPQSKWSAEQIPSRRTREVTSGAKRDGHVPTRAHYADESESMPRETKVTQAFSDSNVEKWSDGPSYARDPVQQPSARTEYNESPIARGKSQKAEMDTLSVPVNENAETSTGTPEESTAKTAPAHVHPKLPTDYDSFAAHFKSLRTNRR